MPPPTRSPHAVHVIRLILNLFFLARNHSTQIKERQNNNGESFKNEWTEIGRKKDAKQNKINEMAC